ncbi:hypothetical protein MKY59_02255 [Paenibacillus sp. FSL W8-0426]|uniref:hypothetical protein n=1 Tax=Paenibacillus sp. FSL W8-0426 TaxID=2921714 RepID=UPI0030DA70F9
MPTTKREQVVFGLMMCFGMVTIMLLFNLYNSGMIGKLSLMEILLQFVICFVVAFAVESILVGPVAKKVAFSLPFDKSNKLVAVLTLSFFMVVGMVLVMSFYGVMTSYLTNGLGGRSILRSYGSAIGHNFLLALPAQLLVVGPIVRAVFGNVVDRSKVSA